MCCTFVSSFLSINRFHFLTRCGNAYPLGNTFAFFLSRKMRRNVSNNHTKVVLDVYSDFLFYISFLFSFFLFNFNRVD